MGASSASAPSLGQRSGRDQAGRNPTSTSWHWPTAHRQSPRKLRERRATAGLQLLGTSELKEEGRAPPPADESGLPKINPLWLAWSQMRRDFNDICKIPRLVFGGTASRRRVSYQMAHFPCPPTLKSRHSYSIVTRTRGKWGPGWHEMDS